MVPAVLSGNLVLAIMRGGMYSVVYSFINFPDVCVLFFFSHDSDVFISF